MAIIPQIIRVPLGEFDNGITRTVNAATYIEIKDASTGELTPGNGISVSYQRFHNGVPGIVQTVQIIGYSQKIDEGTVQEVRISDEYPLNITEIQIVSYDTLPPDEPPVNPGVCDVVINMVGINIKESAPGAADGRVIVYVSTSQLPISYSLDGVNFQPSAVFENLTGGTYTAYVSDAAGCTATKDFILPTVQSLLVDDPSVDIGNGNLSRWNAAFNPVVFTYQRRDFDVDMVTYDGNGNMLVSVVNADVSKMVDGDKIYLDAAPYKGVYEVKSVSGNMLTIKSPYISNATGSVNINRLRPYYCIKTRVSYFDRDTGRTKTIEATNRPDNTGLVRADISSFLQSLLQVKDDSNYSVANFRDTDLSASYNISYAEEWDGIPSVTYHNITHPFYIVYAAKQLGDAYGGNLAAYVPFPTVNSTDKLAKWITDFAEPAYSNSYPFDIGFIYSDAIAGLNIYAEMSMLDINRQPIGSPQNSYLLNENGSFLLNQDGSKMVIAYATVAGQQGLVQQVGLNRLLVNQSFPGNAHYFTLTLKYDDNGTPRPITRTQIVRIDKAVDDNSVYLRWIGLTGCWNYYRFVYDQEVSLDVQNAVIIKKHVSDWADQDGIEDVISKSAGMKMKVMAEDLSVADIKGLQSIKYSPKVQMLVGRSPVKWRTVVLNTATFAEYQTKNGQAPFSVTFNLPSLNIQTQ